MHMLEGGVVGAAAGEEVGEEVEDLFLVQRVEQSAGTRESAEGLRDLMAVLATFCTWAAVGPDWMVTVSLSSASRPIGSAAANGSAGAGGASFAWVGC